MHIQLVANIKECGSDLQARLALIFVLLTANRLVQFNILTLKVLPYNLKFITGINITPELINP